MIKQISLDHLGGLYYYKVHNKKVDSLCKDFPQLKTFLYDMFENCPNSYFESGPRSSSLKFNLKNLNTVKTKGHEVSTLSYYGLLENGDRYNSNHLKVQMFMLESDNKTIAMEIPIWLHPNEIDRYYEIFGSNEPLTGHIDILRVEDGKIWVWDYKPNAIKEKYATTQVSFYALMLSKRTNIPLEQFRCGYFDKDYAFMFKPNPEVIPENQLKSLFDFFRKPL